MPNFLKLRELLRITFVLKLSKTVTIPVIVKIWILLRTYANKIYRAINNYLCNR